MISSPAVSRSRNAFTLIEILVVVAIMALLMSILLPSLRNARGLAKATVCGTQLNQIFQASLMYSHGNEDRLPYFGWYDSAYTGRHWWVTQIARNIGNQFDLLKCPVDENPTRQWVVRDKGILLMSQLTEPKRYQMDITYRSACDSLEHYTGPGGATSYRARKMNSWKFPYRAILMVEASPKRDEASSACFRFKDDIPDIISSTLLRNSTYAHLKGWQRHLGKSNLMFADGHVERMMPKQVVALAAKQEHYLP